MSICKMIGSVVYPLDAKIAISFELTSGEESVWRAILRKLDGDGRRDVRVGVVVGEGEVVVDEVEERLPTVS